MKSLLPRICIERGTETIAVRGLPGRSSTDATWVADNFPSALSASARCGLEGRAPTVFLLVFAVLFGVGPFVATAGPSEDIDSAFRQLVLGRSYLKDFPQLKTKTKLVQDYLGTDANGVYLGSGDLFANLQQAVSSAVQARDQLGPNSTEDGYGQYIAWEALEALMSGQLYAGNSDLLNGLRVAFPIASTGKPPGTDRPLPLGIPRRDTSEYAGANLMNLGYARLHFFRGLIATLDYLSADRDGRLRAVDHLSYPQSPNYTVFNSTNFLPKPRFADTNFTSLPPQPTQTAAYLYGNLVNRFGIANVSIGDKLWRAAFFSKENKPLKEEMLDKATAHLRRSIHAQFLATLPLAATLSDGLADPDQPDNEFQVARLEQVRSSVAAAVNLMDRINRREAPKLDNLRLQIDDQEIQRQISDTQSILLTLNDAYTTAQQKIKDLEQADSLKANDVINLRTQYEREMESLCAISPSAFGGLKTPEQRAAYRDAIETAFDRRMKAGLDSPDLVDGSKMGAAAISVLRAANDIGVVNVQIDSIPEQIRIEEERNGEVNSTIVVAGRELGALDIAIGIQKALPKTFLGFPTSGVQCDPSAIGVGLLEAAKDLISTDRETSINNINSRAVVRNLLLKQRELAAQLPSSVAQFRLSIAEMNSLHKQLLRLIDDDVFVQDTTANLWYNDPSVVFEQSKAELDYQDALNASIVQLYILAYKLASRWGEQFENPLRKGDGTTFQPLGPENYDDFTEPESVFTIADHLSAKKFYRALGKWDGNLRNERRSPIGAIQPDIISLRQDLLGLSDYVWDTNRLQFVTDPQRRDRNIALFRAYLLNAQKFNAPKHTFELEFGVNYFTPRRSTMTREFSSLLIPQGDGDWNQRLTSVSSQILGNDITQEPTVPFTVYQFGRTYTQSFFNRNEASRVDDLTLYYRDPRSLTRTVPWEGSQQFLVNAAIGNVGTPEKANLTGQAITPFCDKYLLTIESSRLVAPVNLQNITDIQFTFEWTVGPPPVFSWPSVP